MHIICAYLRHWHKGKPLDPLDGDSDDSDDSDNSDDGSGSDDDEQELSADEIGAADDSVSHLMQLAFNEQAGLTLGDGAQKPSSFAGLEGHSDEPVEGQGVHPNERHCYFVKAVECSKGPKDDDEGCKCKVLEAVYYCLGLTRNR